MTTLPLVSAGGATPTLPEPPATHLDTQHARLGDALGAGNAPLTGSHGGDMLALLTAGHDLHPLAQQQQQVAYFGTGGTGHVAGTKAPAHTVVPDAATRI
jgi:hypothetical protein